jgi:hypothetical protein
MQEIIVTTSQALEAIINRVFDARLPQLSSTSIINNSPAEIIDDATLCKRLNITPPTSSRYRKKGKIPYLQIGSAIRYNWPQVVKALENKKTRA